MPVEIRPLMNSDAPDCARVFYEAVTIGAKKHYSEEQLAAWAGPAPAPERWSAKLHDMTGFVAVKDNSVIGFMTIDAKGYIEFAFTSPYHTRQGIGTAIYDQLQNWAEQRNISTISVDISMAAKAFFLHHGWLVEREQAPVVRGVALTNFLMTKNLAA
ncbi:GNAT family N-acetyltransferase [Pseudovibrio sp. Ad37]|uniref:GNAT family N-acetyltransferase n=1 Tax=Pseudovibrio sp. Ad37 TaxID=989422 RepID=UPI0007AE5202|nr:GNAT family N-acetyltransferase [Pseudovibrio sp. Ad37]KZL26208.1 putative N-acetyltransferase YafP [Pseudovibrio sp. Ad37]